MSWLSSWTRAWSRSAPVWLLMPLGLWLSLASGVRAQASPVVVWLGGDGGDAEARERALRLELDARGFTLLRADPPVADASAPAAPPGREAFARQTLVRSGAHAVLWLDSDATRPVSWLRVVHERSDATEQAPLPHPPDAIDPELFAIAAASLLEQVLRPPPADAVAAGPGVEPPTEAPATPVAAQAVPAPAPAPAAASPPSAPPRAPADRAAARPPDPTEPVWFVQAGLALSLAQVRSGMEAATRPRTDQIFSTENGRSFFDLASPWVPDGDSFDDFEAVGIPRGRTPAPSNCPADGIATGPLDLDAPDGQPFEQLEPSSYCARVEEPGFELVPALRMVVGLWVLPRLAVGVLYQGHFGIDADSFFGNQLFGVQAEYLALGMRGRGVALSLLGELTAGRTETPVTSGQGRPTVNALSGPFGAQAGALARLWPVSRFALFASPTLGARFPASQLLVDLVAGAEVAF